MRSSAAASASAACGVNQPAAPGPRPTTTTSPAPGVPSVPTVPAVPTVGAVSTQSACDARSGAGSSGPRTGLGSTASEKYGTVAGSTAPSGAMRWPEVVARSTYQVSARRPAAVKASRTPGKVRPILSTTAVSVPAIRSARAAGGSVPGSTVRTSLPSTSGRPSTAHPADRDVTPGTTSVGYRSARRRCRWMNEP